WNERLPWILDPDVSGPLIKKSADLRGEPDVVSLSEPSLEDHGSWATVRVTLESSKGDRNRQEIYLQRAADGYLVDWQATVGYNELDLKAFRLQPTGKPVR